ncbi:MAG: hypothetical protein ACTSUS_07550, partial [Candidatus Freyarchaeota archaeon]
IGDGVIDEDKVVERKLLLKRTFPLPDLFEMGMELNVPYFRRFVSCWEIDEDEAALEIALNISDMKLRELYKKYVPRDYVTFRGKHYTFQNGVLRLAGSWEKIRAKISEVKKKYGRNCTFILNEMVRSGGTFGLEEVGQALKHGVNPYPILASLEKLKVIVASYKGEKYQEWRIPDEILPLIQQELGMPIQKPAVATPSATAERVDYVEEERRKVEAMDQELTNYLNDLVKHRLTSTIRFGKTFSAQKLADYLQKLFGHLLYFDSFLSIIQQYGLADVGIVTPQGKTGMRTGWSLALFGEPGTGKSFSTRDMILGGAGGKIRPHGIPGRNRYCGGMTPARFIRIGQAYVGRTFNFIVPEFNDWFRGQGMTDVLKVAMERGEIKYELHREVVGPYRFGSYFSVNYNTKVFGRGYEVTISDPNYNAIEDRMICRLHRLTKERFVEIAQSQMRVALGEIDVEKGARRIRDHVTLVYAIETGHPLVGGQFPRKPVMITSETYDMIKMAREAILEQIPQKSLRFSARLEKHAIRFACAASLLNYFHSDLDYIPVSEEAVNYAVKLYVEEASVRSREEFRPEEVLEKFFANPKL